MVDNLGDALRAAAARDVLEPGAVLACGGVFGEVAEDRRFVAAYRAAIRAVRERGPEGALERVAR